MRLPLLLFLLAGCAGGEDTDDTDVDCSLSPDLTWANWGDPFFRTWCQSCHSADTPNRFGAPEGIDFDTLEDVRLYEGAIHQTVLVDETMPVGGGIEDTQLDNLAWYLSCKL